MPLALRRLLRALVVPALASASAAGAQITTTPSFFAVNPNGTYLRTSAETPAGPTIISLAGWAAGTQLQLSAAGQMLWAGDYLPVENLVWDGAFTAVFTSSTDLLDWAQPNRVPGAIGLAGGLFPAVTSPTYYGGLPTDIDEDFAIAYGGMTVVIPTGAQYLMVNVDDSFYTDNGTPHPSTFGVTINAVTSTPEPATLALVGGGLALVGAAARRRRRA